MSQKTHFGSKRSMKTAKASRVREVFTSVAPSYDLMNDLMSGGLHRLWKKFAIDLAQVRAGERVLDVASGTGIWPPPSRAPLAPRVRSGRPTSTRPC